MSYSFPYPPRPKIIQIETSVLCNAKCVFCPQKKVKRTPKLMDEKLFRKIVDQTRGLGVLYRLFLFGEPFADPRMINFLKYIKEDPSAEIDLDSNGGLLTQKLADELIACAPIEVRFSIDGFYKETCRERRGLDRDAVYRNVGYFAEAVRASKLPIKTAVRMIHIPGNEKEEKEYEDFWSSRVDSVVFTTEYRYPWEGQKAPILVPCLKIRNEMFFYVNGRTPLCCWDTDERSFLGDVNSENVLDIWNGKRMQAYRKILDAGRRDVISLCSRCDAYAKYDFKKENFCSPANDDEIIPLLKDL